MYKKLCKYEFKSIARTLLPIYLAVIVVSVINALSLGLNDLFFSGPRASGLAVHLPESHILNALFGIFQMVVVLAYFGVMVALFVITLVVIIQRFYKGLLCDEGYLMFTLPVKPWQLIASKGTAALVMSVVSGIAAFLSFLILMCGAAGPMEFFSSLFDPRIWGRMIQDLGEIFPKWGLYVIVYGVELLVLCIVSGMKSLFHMYVSMALGHLAKKHRILMALVAYIVISMGMSFLSGVLLIVTDASGITNMLSSLLDTMSAPGGMNLACQIVILGLFLWEALQLAAYFIGTERILSKKLNLE